MKRYPDIDRALEVWMADGPAAIPDRVVDVVAARIAVNRQRRPWPFPGRTNVTAQIKLIAALAAVLVVGVVGYNLLPGSSSPGAPTTAPTPTAQPTVATTAAPLPSPTFLYPSAALLPAGTHATKSFSPAFTLTVPEGWINDGDAPEYYSLFPDTPANRAEFARTGNAEGGILVASQLPRPYFVCEAWEDNGGATAAKMAAAVTANEALLTSGVVDVAIGGLTGKQLDVRINPDWSDKTCPGDPPGTDLSSAHARTIFLDRPGSTVLVIFLPPDNAEAQTIVESLEFDLGQ